MKINHLDGRFIINNAFVKNFGYLFFVDIERLEYDNYESYEKRESGYSNALLEAYKFAFDTDIKRTISGEFIQNVHHLSMSHLPQKLPGKYKKAPNNFLLGHPFPTGAGERPALNFNVTYDGFFQFVKTWLINEKNPIHFIHFKSPSGDEVFLLPVNPSESKKIRRPWVQIVKNRRVVHMEEYTEAHKVLLKKYLSNSEFKCFVNSTPTDLAPFLGYTKDTIDQVVAEHVDKICNNYNKAIREAISDNEKIFIIIEHIQLLAQLHPFEDGNTRTMYILLNRLLHEENLPLSLIINPNRFDCLSIGELFGLVTYGQEAYLQFCQEKVPVLKDDYPMNIPEIKPTPIIGSEKGMLALVDMINNNLNRMHKYYLIDTSVNAAIVDRVSFYKEVDATSTSLVLNEKLGLSFKNYQRPNLLVDCYHSLELQENIDDKIQRLEAKGIRGHFSFFKDGKAFCIPSINTTEVASIIREL